MANTAGLINKPSIDSFLKLVRARRSVRTGYLEDVAVPDEYVMKIIEAGRWAPSGGNGQPWEFIVIRNRLLRYKIAELFQKQLLQKGEIQSASGKPGNFSSGSGFKNAPVYIVVLGDPRVWRSYPIRTALEKSESHFYSELANACMLMMLAAETLGLSTQWLSDVSSPWFSVMLKELLQIPEQLHVYHLIPVGFSNNRPEAHYRRPIDEMIHFDKYDMAKYRTDDQFDRFVNDHTRRSKEYKI
ncbi:MAG: nitroreductase family protein [Nitrososphaerales archaeon]